MHCINCDKEFSCPICERKPDDGTHKCIGCKAVLCMQCGVWCNHCSKIRIKTP